MENPARVITINGKGSLVYVPGVMVCGRQYSIVVELNTLMGDGVTKEQLINKLKEVEGENIIVITDMVNVEDAVKLKAMGFDPYNMRVFVNKGEK